MAPFFSVNVYISVHCVLYLSSQQSTLMCQQSTFHWGDPVSQWAGESCTEKGTINTRVRLARWRWLCFKESVSSVFGAYTRLESKCAKSRQVSLWCWLIIDLFFLREINYLLQLLHHNPPPFIHLSSSTAVIIFLLVMPVNSTPSPICTQRTLYNLNMHPCNLSKTN